MDRRVRRMGVVVTASLALAGAAAWSAVQPQEPAVGAPAEAAGAPDVPGASHIGLVALAGEWTSVSVLTMPAGDGQDAAAGSEAGGEEPGLARLEAVLDGGFIVMHESGRMMGEPFKSMKVFGFNNAAGIYESTWIYTGSTAMLRMRGTSEDGGRIISFQAQYATALDVNERFLVTMAVRTPDEFAVTLTALLEDGSAGPAMQTVYSRVR